VLAADELASHLDWSGLFVEAIETLSSIWGPLPPKSQTNAYMRKFLARNEAALIKAFGPRDYEEWVARYSPPSAALSSMPKAVRTIVRSALAGVGKSRRIAEKPLRDLS
jgi:hypothetical protein